MIDGSFLQDKLNDTSSDFGVLVDIISNAAGMMILFACFALVLNYRELSVTSGEESGKPISFPMSYLPVYKQPIVLALKNGYLYVLPNQELLDAFFHKASFEGPLEQLIMEKDGVRSVMQFSPVGLGFQFAFYLLPSGGISLNNLGEIYRTMNQLLKNYSPSNYFVNVYVWPEYFEQFRLIREYLIERKMEVGWIPRYHVEGVSNLYPDVVLGVNNYQQGFQSIKAQ